MGAQINALIKAFALFSLATAAYATPEEKYSAVENFKNYALSTCIADGYSAEETTKDAAAAARGYLEFGTLPLEAHTQATKLGREFLKKQSRSMSGQKMTLMKCIDLFHSKELDQLARKYQAQKTSDF